MFVYLTNTFEALNLCLVLFYYWGYSSKQNKKQKNLI